MKNASTPTMAEFEARCRRLGLPVTTQRRAVLRALARRADHPTADQLYEDLRESHPDLSRTTVYRVLDALVRLGVVRRASHPGAAVRYDALITRHHHLVCTACGAMADLPAPALDTLPAPRSVPPGFELVDYSVYFHGTCSACRRHGATAPAKKRGPASRSTRRPARRKKPAQP